MQPEETSTQADEPAGEPTAVAAKPVTESNVAMSSQELGFKDPKKEEKEVKKVSAENLDW